MKKRTFSRSTRVNFSVHCCLVGLLLSLAIVFSYLFLPLATSARVASGPSTGKAATSGQPVTQQPQAAPMVAGPGRLIFGVGGVYNGLLMTNSDGTNAVNLTDSGAAQIQHPSVSAQTGMIAFDAQNIQITPPLSAQDRRIFVMNGDGSGVRQITFVPNQANPLFTQDFNPEISPDGTKVAFISARTAGQIHQCTMLSATATTTNEVWVVNIDGTNLHQVTHPKFLDDPNFGCDVANNYAVAWSSDSQQLAVLGRRKYTFTKINVGVSHMYNSISIDDADTGIAYNFGTLDGGDKEPVRKARIATTGFIDWAPSSTILFEANLGGASGENNSSIGYLRSGPAICGVDGGGPGGGGGGGFADCTAAQTLMGQIGFGGSTDGLPHGGQIFNETGSVRYSPDGSGIVIAGVSPLANNGLIPTVFVGNGSVLIPASQNSGWLGSGIAWAAGPAIPTPNQLVLTPNPLLLYNLQTVPVTPTLLDAQGNVIVRSAVWHSGTAGFRCDSAPNQVPCSGTSLGAPDIDFTGKVTWKDREIVGNLCGENGLLRTCIPYINSQTTLTVAASTPTASVHNATPGVFTFTRLGDPSGALVINFSLSGTATRNVDYTLNQAGNTITMASGATSVTINVQPTGNSFGSGDKTVILTLQPDPSNAYRLGTTNNTGTVTIKDELFEKLALDCLLDEQSADVQRKLLFLSSNDPNEKDGSQGAGPEQYVTGKEPLRYVISFENIASATAPAQTVVVTDQLDASKVDLSTISLGAVSFNIHGAAPLPGASSYSTDIDLRPANNLITRVNAQLDKNTGLLTWRFTSIDPATGQPTTDPLAGFLPPDKNAPEGQGSVTFSVMPNPNLPTGTEIRNKARIVFDNNAPIDTPEWLNTIDNSPPTSHVIPLASNQSSIVFNVSWAGQDTGAGIQSFDVYVSESGGSFTPWLSDTSATSAIFIGLPGQTYSFFSIARDGAGNIEAPKTVGETLTSTPSSIVNSIDDPRYFVWRHYIDFLSRQPDQSGWDFWTNQITQCGNDTQCVEVRRINVSAAFFLSIEFQETGYLAYLTYKESYGNLPGAPVPVRLNELLPDAQEIGSGVVVGQTGWEQVLETNKQAYMLEFAQRSRFTSAFPTTMTPAQFVDTLYLNAGVTPSASDRTNAINEFGVAATTDDIAARARVLRRVADNAAFRQQEFNKAFVLMQYFGYLRRNPNDAPDSDFSGYNFWLSKLNQFGGNFVNAEMVKAFIVSGEYRQRFGP